MSPLSPHTHIPIFFIHTRNLVSHTQSHIHKYVLYSHAYIHTRVYAIHRQSESCAKHLTSLPIYTHTYFSRTHANTYSHIYYHIHTKTLTAARTFTHIYLHTQAKSTMPGEVNHAKHILHTCTHMGWLRSVGSIKL